jgi:putative ABC transport system ATP-binding protein
MDRPHRGPAGPARAGGAPVTADLRAAAAAPGTAKIIEARNLEKSFGQTPALRGASLGVRPGEIVAVMGPSGSGKSTLLHCLAGILVPDQGEAWYGGQRLDTLSDDRRSALRRDRFGFVFQSGQLVPELTAEENIALPLLLSGTRRGPAMTAARKWFGTLGLDGLERRRSGELSGGQAQRVALARALAAEPRLLLLDEPAAGLNAHETDALAEIIQQINARGVTVLLIEHDVGLVTRIAHRIAVLDFGCKIAEGTPDEIKQHPDVIAAYLGTEAAHA